MQIEEDKTCGVIVGISDLQLSALARAFGTSERVIAMELKALEQGVASQATMTGEELRHLVADQPKDATQILDNDPVHKGMAKFKLENARRAKFRK